MLGGILEREFEERVRGPLVFAGRKYFVASVSIQSQSIKFASVDFSGETYFEKDVDIRGINNQEALTETVIENLGELVDMDSRTLCGISVSAPGIIDTERGLWKFAVNLPYVHKLNLKEILETKFDTDVVLENDIRCALWAGIWFDKTINKYDHAIYLDITEGVSTSILIDGKPYYGANYSAGEIGHIRSGEERRKCRCGKLDCLETYSSVPAILKEIKIVAPEFKSLIDSSSLVKAAQKSMVVKNVIVRAMQRLASHLAVFIAGMEPQAIILVNEKSEFYNLVLPFLEKALNEELNGSKQNEPVKFVIAGRPGKATVLGSAAMLLDKVFKETELLIKSNEASLN